MTSILPTRIGQQFTLADKLLKRTISRCPVCHTACPAEVWRKGGIPAKVFLNRACPEHGETSVCIASDARFYWLAQGKAENGCGCGPTTSSPVDLNIASSPRPSPPEEERAKTPGFACCASDGSPAGTLGRNSDPGQALGIQEKLSTCLALIEIVNSCNLACPTCYADSPVGTGTRVDAVPLEDLERRIQGVIDRKGKIEILQLSGGEPTLHPEFFELLHWLQNNPGIQYVLLNTNGVRIANDDAFAEKLEKAFRYGAFQLYLQFDGSQEEGQRFLRGADLRETRLRCLERCAEMKLPVTLAMTVMPENLPFLWEAIEFGLHWPNVRGISFQPMFGSGRVPGQTVPKRSPSPQPSPPGEGGPSGGSHVLASAADVGDRSQSGVAAALCRRTPENDLNPSGPGEGARSDGQPPPDRDRAGAAQNSSPSSGAERFSCKTRKAETNSVGSCDSADPTTAEPVTKQYLQFGPADDAPSPGGEGRGEGERLFQLHRSGGEGQGEGKLPPQLNGFGPEKRAAVKALDQGIQGFIRLNTADIILAAVEQSRGRLRFEDFTPLPCGDPNCATIGYLLKIGGQVRSISNFIDFNAVQGFLSDKVRYKLEDLMRCGCESEPLGKLLKEFELDESHTFRLFIKPFMDAWTWDEDRIDRCCTHVIRPDGKLDSFCRYYGQR